MALTKEGAIGLTVVTIKSVRPQSVDSWDGGFFTRVFALQTLPPNLSHMGKPMGVWEGQPYIYGDKSLKQKKKEKEKHGALA